MGRPPRRRPRTKDASTPSSPVSVGCPLLIIDEVGYIPFDGEAANLFFQLVSARYERASVIVTSQQALRPLGRSLR